MTDQRMAVYFCALVLCQMIFHLGEVEGGISFRFLCEGNLLSDPLPPLFGQVSKERCSLWPSPASGVKEKLVKFHVE